MKDKLLHFLGELFAKSIWVVIGLLVIIVGIILSPFALISYIQDKLFYNNRYI